ncbi:ABC transporter substrate-binding protein [Alloyangia pacifica]|uniref:ABC transporter substrate-binding protein n=1 Tax=Alloyangia pacifica TaxID=311180 RepID=UPI001CFE4003|nr:extracellular solute-binding protein [Alloyangia pacifica]
MMKSSALSRRTLLKTASALPLTLAAPAVLRAGGEPLKVGVYGGYFQDSFDSFVYPEFTKATGIEIESIAVPTGEAWLIQLQQAARAKRAPADVSMMATVSIMRGMRTGLWAPLDETAMPNVSNILPTLINRYDDDGLAAVGAVSWYVTVATNTDVFPQPIESWAELWEPKYEDSLGLLALVSNSYLLEITAKTFFGGTDYLSSDETIREVLAKVAELKPNTRLWYRDEAQFEQALKSGEIPIGQYYHDVTGLAAADGFPVRSNFPKEGGLRESGNWGVARVSDKIDQAQVFIDYMSQPSVQAMLARNLGTAPNVARESMDLTDEEFAAVSSDIEPVIPRYDLHFERTDWLNQIWAEMLQA